MALTERARIHHQMPKSQQSESIGLNRNSRGHIIQSSGYLFYTRGHLAEAQLDYHGTKAEVWKKIGQLREAHPKRNFTYCENGANVAVPNEGSIAQPFRAIPHETAKLPLIED